MEYSFDFTHNGRAYRADILRDEYMGAPWQEHDGHGEVSDWTTRDKRPGELVLSTDGHHKRFYDFAGAVKTAKAEGWNAAPYFPPGKETKGQRAAKAARADYEHLRRWCADLWFWAGVVVKPICECCGTPDESRAASVWGIESESMDYLREVARELADEMAPEEAVA
jgi:hypothetical protein